MNYDAFLCFSYVDRELADAIARGLTMRARDTRWSVPFVGRSGLRVFRATDAAVAGDIRTSIVRALESSRFLILIASPAAAASEWVARELEFWLRTRPRDSILVVLADGTPESAIPAAIAEDWNERLWLDLRWASGIADIADRPQFADAIATLSAAILGVAKDALFTEEVRRNRRFRRMAILAAATVVVLMGALLLAAIAAATARRRVEMAIVRAEQEQRIAAQATRKAVAAAANARAMQHEAERQARLAAERVARLEQELAEFKSEGGSGRAFRAFQSQIDGLKVELKNANDARVALAGKLAKADKRAARAEAAVADREYELILARAQLRQRDADPWRHRLVKAMKPYATEVASLAFGALLLFILSTRWILLLLRLEFKPIVAVAVPFYLTRLGRWRLFRGYRKRAVTSEVEFHTDHYLDIPYAVDGGTGGGEPLVDFVSRQADRKNLVVIAGGGRGKTTLCHKLLVCALDRDLTVNGRPVFPVVIDGLTYDGNLLRTITDTLVQHRVFVNAAIVDAQLTSGMLMVIFDGWSEVPAAVEAHDEKADAPSAIRRYPDARFIFNSRTALTPPLDHALREPVTVQLQDVDRQNLPLFLQRYLVRRAAEAETLAGELALIDLALPYTPLMLRLVATVFDASGEIPAQRTTLFKSYFEKLFRPRAAREIELEAIEYLVKHLTRFTYLATYGRRGFPLYRGIQLIGEIKDVMDGFGVRSLPIDLLKLLLGAGLYRKSGDRMRCFHDSFESYFAAQVLYDEFVEDRYDLIIACASDITFVEAFEFLLEIVAAAGETERLMNVVEATRPAIQLVPSGIRGS